MPIVAVAPLGARSVWRQKNRVQLIRNMRSHDSKTNREMPFLLILMRMSALTLVLALVFAAPASASTVARSGDEVTFTAAAGENNAPARLRRKR